MNKTPIQNEEVVNLVKKRKLTRKQRAFITEYIKNGQNGVQAVLRAYDTSYDTARAIASENLAKPNIKEAIEMALAKSEVTPEFAIGNIKKVATLTDENPTASLSANKLILQLHGWKEGERPSTTLQIKNAFFNKPRNTSTNDSIIEGDVVQ